MDGSPALQGTVLGISGHFACFAHQRFIRLGCEPNCELVRARIQFLRGIFRLIGGRRVRHLAADHSRIVSPTPRCCLI